MRRRPLLEAGGDPPPGCVTDEDYLRHLEVVWCDLRQEVLKRVEQRDRYTLQLIVALGAILGFALAGDERHDWAIYFAPLVAIYFTVVILYSYLIHAMIAKYLREEIEARMESLIRRVRTRQEPWREPSPIHWEAYYSRHQTPGIRKSLFAWVMVCVTLGSFGFMAVQYLSDFPQGAIHLRPVILLHLAYVLTVWQCLRFFGREFADAGSSFGLVTPSKRRRLGKGTEAQGRAPEAPGG